MAGVCGAQCGFVNVQCDVPHFDAGAAVVVGFMPLVCPALYSLGGRLPHPLWVQVRHGGVRGAHLGAVHAISCSCSMSWELACCSLRGPPALEGPRRGLDWLVHGGLVLTMPRARQYCPMMFEQDSNVLLGLLRGLDWCAVRLALYSQGCCVPPLLRVCRHHCADFGCEFILCLVGSLSCSMWRASRQFFASILVAVLYFDGFILDRCLCELLRVALLLCFCSHQWACPRVTPPLSSSLTCPGQSTPGCR